MKRLAKRNSPHLSKNSVKDFLVRAASILYNLSTNLDLLLTTSTRVFASLEEFGIYLNYVRKLSFEETPDYDFLRDLFTKALKSMNEVEDGVYDWMLLNNGKGWESELDVSFLRQMISFLTCCLIISANVLSDVFPLLLCLSLSLTVSISTPPTTRSMLLATITIPTTCTTTITRLEIPIRSPSVNFRRPSRLCSRHYYQARMVDPRVALSNLPHWFTVTQN